MNDVASDAASNPPSDSSNTDAELMRQIVAQRQEALSVLYARYAPLVFHLASHSLEGAAAEDIVQDVFLAVWRKADTFDARRGTVRAWLLQIAHFRILNELRRRSRRPQLEPDAEGELLEEVPDGGEGPVEAAWRSFRRDAVRAAINKLPPTQRQALSLAFFDDLTQDQVASMLNVPLGTVKTRIRTAMQSLRLHLAAIVVSIALAGTLITVGLAYQFERNTLGRNERAVSMLASSETKSLHLSPASGTSQNAHGSYRSRAGIGLAVVAVENLPPAPAGKSYQGWAQYQGKWLALGALSPGQSGHDVLIVEDARLAMAPADVKVTLEPSAGSQTPSGAVVLSWLASVLP